MDELQKNYEILLATHLDDVDRILKIWEFILSIKDKLTEEEIEEFKKIIK